MFYPEEAFTKMLVRRHFIETEGFSRGQNQWPVSFVTYASSGPMPNTGPQRHRYWWDVLLSHSVNTISCTKISQFMRFREIIAVCSQIHTKHINALCEQNVELLNVKLVVRIVTTGLRRGYIYYTYRFSPYRAVNTLRLCYKNQPVIAV